MSTTKKLKPQMKGWSEVNSLDESYYRMIGEVIFQWNCVENNLMIAAKRMLGIGIKHARIAMRSPRPEEILEMIEELALINDEPLGNWEGFKAKLSKGERARNLICHARWLDVNGKPACQETIGTAKVPFEGSYKRRHFPDARLITPKWLDEILDNAIECRQLAEKLGKVTSEIQSARQDATSDGT